MSQHDKYSEAFDSLDAAMRRQVLVRAQEHGMSPHEFMRHAEAMHAQHMAPSVAKSAVSVTQKIFGAAKVFLFRKPKS